MAGEWIKMRADLTDDPTVVGMCIALRLEDYSVVGRLHKLWAWADRHTTNGVAVGVGPEWVDRFVGKKGFAAAMIKFGWLKHDADNNSLTIPNFDRHNGASAKSRALDNRNKAERRKREPEQDNWPENVPPAPGQKTDTTPDQRREEKNKDTTYPLAPRPRDAVFDALCEIEGSPLSGSGLTRDAAKRIGTAAADIKRATPEVTAAMVHERAMHYRAIMPGADLTAKGLASHWGRCAKAPAPATVLKPKHVSAFA